MTTWANRRGGRGMMGGRQSINQSTEASMEVSKQASKQTSIYWSWGHSPRCDAIHQTRQKSWMDG